MSISRLHGGGGSAPVGHDRRGSEAQRGIASRAAGAIGYRGGRDGPDRAPGSSTRGSTIPSSLLGRALYAGGRRDPAELALSLILAAAAIAVPAFATVDASIASSTLGFAWGGAAAGLVSQLATTLPAVALVLVASAINVAAGAVVLRVARRRPFESIALLLLGGFATAILVDTFLLLTLGNVGLFRGPIVLAVELAILAAGWLRLRPILGAPARVMLANALGPRGSVGRVAWIRWGIVAVAWIGPLLLTLSSPVVPFMDVLPNHVAPIEHVVAFGSFENLVVSPSPIYGPSRIFLGYVGLLGTIATTTGYHAALAVSAFSVPLTALSGIGVFELARRAFGREAAWWALLTFPLTFVFVRLADDRATVLVFVLVALALALLCERRLRPSDAAGHDDPRRTPEPTLAIALGAALLIHPEVGAFALATVGGVALTDPRRRLLALAPSLAAGAVAALPQGATMLGLALPAWVGAIALPAGAGVYLGLALAVRHVPLPPVRARTAMLVLLAVALLAAIVYTVLMFSAAEAAARAYIHGLEQFVSLALLAGFGAVIARGRPRGGVHVLVVGAAVALAAIAITQLAPTTTLAGRSFRYEVPTKTLGYWLPWLLAIGAAAAIGSAWRLIRIRPLALLPAVALLVIAIVPVGTPRRNVDEAEQAYSGMLAYALRTAQSGYWRQYPDWRYVVNANGMQLVDFLRAEEGSGALTSTSTVLHVAKGFQQWESVPIGVFTGAIETSVSTNPPVNSIHAIGGRLHPLADLGRELAAAPTCVVLEPKGLASSVRDEIVAAGYRSIWSNAQAEVFLRA